MNNKTESTRIDPTIKSFRAMTTPMAANAKTIVNKTLRFSIFFQMLLLSDTKLIEQIKRSADFLYANQMVIESISYLTGW